MIEGFVEEIEAGLSGVFNEMERIAMKNTRRVLDSFRRCRVSDSHFTQATGYGYGDIGRDTLDRVYAEVFGAEDALVRIQFVNGTHAIACALKTAAPNGGYLSLVGKPYDTLQGVMPYDCIEADAGGCPDTEKISRAISAAAEYGKPYPAVLIQRSRGYSQRKSLSVAETGGLITLVKALSPGTLTIVDNCYGEFVETQEPPMVGADLTAGSLIKNPGGSLALAGGYIAGKKNLVDKAGEMLTVPGIGRECGPSLGQNRSLFQGLFVAPHVVLQALKTAAFCAAALEKKGYAVSPGAMEKRFDIIQNISFGAPEPLISFVRGVQRSSPVDSFAVPEPWDMPGYDNPVIMAAGTFVQGASIELSCDAPIRPPYCAYLQGGITYEAGKLGVLGALEAMGAFSAPDAS